MEPMLERVARIMARGNSPDPISDEVWLDIRDHWLVPARRLLAGMRDPTPQMVAHDGFTFGDEAIWRRMIDAALKEP